MLNANNANSAQANAIVSLGMTTDPINPNTLKINNTIFMLCSHLKITFVRVQQ